MHKENKNLLLRKLLFLENNRYVRGFDSEDEKLKKKDVFLKVREMIEQEEITTMLGVESAIAFCLENIRKGEGSLEEFAERMKNFVI